MMGHPSFYKAQRETIEFGKDHPYLIMALEQGVGKSLCAIALAHETNSRLLIICPSYLMLKLAKEVKKFYPDKSVSILENDRVYYPLWDTEVAITSYYFLHKAEILFEWADMVAFDEAQYLKNMDAKRTDAAHRLVYENSIERVALMSGTPIENRVYEFYSLMALCNYNPKIVESPFLKRFPTYVEFANHFSYLKEYSVDVQTKKGSWITRTVQQWSGLRNAAELREYLSPIFIRKMLSDVVELPPSIDIPVTVSYNDIPELEEEFNRYTESGEDRSVSTPFKVKAAVATAPFTAEYVKDLLEQDLQVVVFSDHPEAAEIIANKLNTRHIDGQTPVHLRQRHADEFQAGERKVVVATTGSFSTGIDLFEAQDTVINDLPWKPSAEDQLRSRTKRIGQKGKCRYHYMVGTIQHEKIREKLEEKRAVIKAAMEGVNT